MSSTYEIELIVGTLNKCLPNKYKNIAPVEFDSIRNKNLLQVLNDVMGYLEPSQNRNVREENAKQTAMRIMSFLTKILNMKVTSDPNKLVAGILSGSKEVIYPILYWLSKNIEDKKQRVYLAKYLVEIQVPEELFQDETVQATYDLYQKLIGEFKQTHKQNMTKKKASVNPDKLKQEISAMEHDKSSLTTKVESLNKKFAENVDDNKDEVLQSTLEYRKTSDEITKYESSLKDQTKQLAQSSSNLMEITEGLKYWRKELGSMSLDEIINRLENETASKKNDLEQVLPKKMAEQAEHLELVNRVAYESVDLEELKEQLNVLQKEVNELIMNKQMKSKPKEDKLRVFRKQRAFMAKQKEELDDLLIDLNKQKHQYEELGVAKQVQKSELANSAKTILKRDFQKYARNLRVKNQMFKSKKAEIGNLRMEYNYLKNTEEILKSRDENLQEYLDETATKKGVSGYVQTQNALESVSQQKSELDAAKVKTLEQISTIVSEIQTSILDRKSKLAPQVKKLKETRQIYQKVEQEYVEKQTQYDSTAHALDSEQSKLVEEVEALQAESEQAESLYHIYNCKLLVASVTAKKISQEQEYQRQNGRLNSEFQSYKAYHESVIAKLEKLSTTLSEKQRYIKENHEPNLKQIAWLMNVVKLLEMKLKLMDSQSDTYQAQEMRDYSNPMVDRLVLQ